MSIDLTPAWPSDPGHRDAIETLLLMAESEDRWGERGQVAHLLDSVEQIVGALPRRYQRMRSRCSSGSQPPQPVA